VITSLSGFPLSREFAPRVQRTVSIEPVVVRNCTKDEGWPFGAVLQGEGFKLPQSAVGKSHGGER